jgi:hypothetical protein
VFFYWSWWKHIGISRNSEKFLTDDIKFLRIWNSNAFGVPGCEIISEKLLMFNSGGYRMASSRAKGHHC